MSWHSTGWQVNVNYETFGDAPGRFLLKIMDGTNGRRGHEREVTPDELLPLLTFIGPDAEGWLRETIQDHLSRCVVQLGHRRRSVIEQTRSLADNEREAASKVEQAEAWRDRLASLGEGTGR